ncbi:MAG: hypothetical protein H6620_10370 [Halobacteriovoraceae bacterium]|nr:hypothetical protein [Halobacteriovoraceae bacterium]
MAKDLTPKDLKSLDKRIKLGLSKQVAIELQGVSLKGKNLEFLSTYSDLARRVGLNILAIKALSSEINRYRESRTIHKIPPKAAITYASCLIRLGLFKEAKEILLQFQDHQDTLLYLAFGYFSKWDYKNAIPPLRSFINSAKDNYQKTIGQVNLAAALIMNQEFWEAQELINSLIRNCKQENNLRLLGNCYEIQAQIYLRKKNLSKTKNSLNQAQKILSEMGDVDLLFVNKWWALIEMLESKNLQKILEIKNKCKQGSKWELLRSMDYYQGLLCEDNTILDLAYRGTLYPAFRELIAKQTDYQEKNCYEQYFSQKNKLRIKGNQLYFNANPIELPFLLKKTFLLLFSDLYQPFNNSKLSEFLYPDDYYHPESTPLKIHQIMNRLKIALKDQGVPTEIKSINQYYFINKNDFHLKYHLNPNDQFIQSTRDEHKSIHEFLIFKKAQEFSSSDLASYLKISPRQSQRLILEELHNENIRYIRSEGRKKIYFAL